MLDRTIAPGVRLRLAEERDAPEMAAAVDADRAHLDPWMPWTRGYSEASALAWIRASRRQLADNRGVNLLIEVDGRISGTVGMPAVDWSHRSMAIGYWLTADVEGRGIMTAAVTALIDHAVDTWGIERVEIRAGTENRRSRAVPERLGFAFEGIARRAERVGDTVLDHAVYGLLAEEWRARRGHDGPR
jgi:ribosomal-protein-serine acetyltransferase